MEEIIVIRATDPDGSVFKAVMDALSGKRAEVVDVAEQSASVLRIGDLEIYCNQHRAFMAGREVVLNHGEYAMLYCMASSPGRVFSKAQLYRPVDKLCPGKRLCRMEWERARKKTPFGVRRKLVSSFLSLMRSRKGGSGLPLPLFLAGKAGPDCSPISARQMSPRSRSAVCAAPFGTVGFPIR